MAMRGMHKKAIVFLVVAVAVSPPVFSQKFDASIFILGEKNGSGVYTFRGKKMPLPDIYTEMEGKFNQASMMEPFGVIFDESVTFKKIINVKGMLEKKGFTNIKYFSFAEGGRYMMSVSLGGVVPVPVP